MQMPFHVTKKGLCVFFITKNEDGCSDHELDKFPVSSSAKQSLKLSARFEIMRSASSLTPRLHAPRKAQSTAIVPLSVRARLIQAEIEVARAVEDHHFGKFDMSTLARATLKQRRNQLIVIPLPV